MLSRARGLTLAAAMLVAAVLLPASPAAANDGGTWNIKVGDSPSQDFGPMAINDASQTFNTDPDTCSTVPWCTLVILHAQYPSTWNPDVNEFVWKTIVSWDAGQSVDAGGGNSETSNDLDIYAYKKVVTKDDSGKESTSYQEVQRSATAVEPEVIRLFNPPVDNPDIYLVVYNSIGPNISGFHVDVKFRDTSIEPLPDYGAPGRPTGSSGGGSSAAEPAIAPYKPAYTPKSPSELPSSMPSLVPTVAPTSPAADDFGLTIPTDKNFASQLGAKQALDILRQSRRTAGPPKSVPAVLLFFWLGVVPLLVGGLVIGWIMRRRPTALTLALSPS